MEICDLMNINELSANFDLQVYKVQIVGKQHRIL